MMAAGRKLERAYRVVMYYVSWPVFGFGAVILQITALLALPLARCRVVQRAVQRLIHVLCRGWVGYAHLLRLAEYRFHGFEQLRGARGLILAANHPSLMDVTLVMSQMPEAVCVYKAAIGGNLLLSASVRAAGFIPNDEGLDLVRQATTALAAGRVLLVFPEGTRTRENVALNPLKPGFALIAQRARAPVQLLFIRTRSHFLTKDRAWWRLPELPPRFDLRVGPRFECDVTQRPAALAGQVADALCRGLQPAPTLEMVH